MDDLTSKVTLIDENGKKVDFDVVTKLDINNKEYLIVIPSSGEESEAVALRIDKDKDGGDVLASVDDEKEYNLVYQAYNEIFLENDDDTFS